jgi:hypothetical protein
MIVKLLIFSYFLFVFISQIFLLVGFSLPYKLFSRMGSYTLFKNDVLIPFGDLVHLTSAATCHKPVRVGSDLCDPWSRPFNQNPDVIQFLKFFHIGNIWIFGILTTLIFFFSIYMLLRIQNNFNILTFIALGSPAVALSIERGNETITLSLLILAMMLYFRNDRFLPFSLLLIFMAGVFKIWPFVFLIVLTLFHNVKFFKTRIFFFTLTISYLIGNIHDFAKIRTFTQHGSLQGNAFGLGLFDLSSYYDVLVLVFGILLGILFIKYGQSEFMVNRMNSKLRIWFLSFEVTYLALWFSGAHFSYRLIILLPLIILLSSVPGTKNLQIFLTFCLFSARFAISPICTTAIVLIMAQLIFTDLRASGLLTSFNTGFFRSLFIRVD